MSTLRRILIVSALAVTATGLASASSIVVNCTPSVVASTELDATITCAGLTGTGILASQVTGIQLEIFGSVDAPPSSLTITNNDTSSHSGYAFTDSEFNFTGVPVGVTLPTDGLGNTFGVIAATCSPTTSSCVNLAGGASMTFPVSGNSNTGLMSVAGADLAAYEGSFSFVGTTATNFTSAFGGGNVSVTQVTTDDLNAEEVITYNPTSSTPEPTTLVLFGSALIGLGCVRKRIRKS
jgi:hypothetical protein